MTGARSIGGRGIAGTAGDPVGPAVRTGDRGSATVIVAMAATMLCALFVVVLALGQVVVAKHRAGAAADLAALAAADSALSEDGMRCRVAARVATAQGAEVVRCVLEGRIADVTVAVRAGPYVSAVRSRAGPSLTEPGWFDPTPGSSFTESGRPLPGS